MIAAERLYLTADRQRVVREGDTEAAFLYAAPGDEIPDSAVEMFGLVDGTIAGGKEAAASADKEAGPGRNKAK